MQTDPDPLVILYQPEMLLEVLPHLSAHIMYYPASVTLYHSAVISLNPLHCCRKHIVEHRQLNECRNVASIVLRTTELINCKRVTNRVEQGRSSNRASQTKEECSSIATTLHSLYGVCSTLGAITRVKWLKLKTKQW